MVLVKSTEKALSFKMWLLPVLSGGLLILSYPPFSLPVFPFFSLLPLFFFFELKNISLKKSFLAGFIFGFIFIGGVMFWLFDTFPLNWLGIDNDFLGFLLFFLPWFLLISLLASFFGLFSLSFRYLKQKKYWNVLLIPSFWIIFEYLRFWSFSIFFAGQESFFGPHWTFGSLAYTLSQNQNLRLLASIGGIYLLSFLIVLVNVLFFFLIKRLFRVQFLAKKIIYSFLILIILVLFSLSYFYPFLKKSEAGKEDFKVVVIQTKFPSVLTESEEIETEKFKIQSQLVKEAQQRASDLDILVFPEGSRFLVYPEAKTILNDLFEKDILVIDSSRTETESGVKAIASVYGLENDVFAQYEKILLVPLGDYLPYLFKLPGQVINEKWVEKVERIRAYKKGRDTVVFSWEDQLSGGVLFCSEVVSPGLHRELAQKGAQIIFNVGSLAFAQSSQGLDSQTQAMLQFRAAENGKYLVRATNFGSSYIINDRGEVVINSPNFDSQVIMGKVRISSQETFYSKYGNWLLVLSAIISAIMIRDFRRLI